jgi:hypothetical protein
VTCGCFVARTGRNWLTAFAGIFSGERLSRRSVTCAPGRAKATSNWPSSRSATRPDRATVSGVLLIIATQPGISPSGAVTRFTNPVPPGLTNPLSTVSGLTNKGGYILRKSNHLMPIQNKLSLRPLVNSVLGSEAPTRSQKTLLFSIA